MEINELIANAEKLSLAEQLQLVTHLLEKMRRGYIANSAPHHQWHEIRGAAPYPLAGEDAQVWVSRARAGADSHRESSLR